MEILARNFQDINWLKDGEEKEAGKILIKCLKDNRGI